MVSKQVEGSMTMTHTSKLSTKLPLSVSVITRGVSRKCSRCAVSNHVGPIRTNSAKLTALPIIQSISGSALATGVAETARTATVRVKRAVRSFIVDGHCWNGTERSSLGAGP